MWRGGSSLSSSFSNWVSPSSWMDYVSNSTYTIGNLISGGPSLDFSQLIRSISDAKTKQEENRIIQAEVRNLKTLISQNDASNTHKMKEILVRLIYCEMLGYKVPFGYVFAINMTQQSNLLLKRVGYLATTLFIHENHELVILLVSSLTRDLKSTNFMEVWMALTCLTRLINTEIIPAVITHVVQLLTHTKAIIRSKAVLVLHRFWLTSRDSVDPFCDKLRIALCDKDIGVMSASLCFFADLVKESPESNKDLVPTFVSILKQISEHSLPVIYEYHGVPSPWIQIKLLGILTILGNDDKISSEHMYTVLEETLTNAYGSKSNAGYAVVYECIRTITSIYPNRNLLSAAAKCISGLLGGDDPNLKFTGMKSLSLLVRIESSFAVEHQMIVIDALEDLDESIRRITLEILFEMTSGKNVTVITEKLLKSLRTSSDTHFRKELVAKISKISERFAPSTEWFIDTMTQVFFYGGKLVEDSVATNFLQVLSAADEENEAGSYAASNFLKWIDNPGISDIFTQVIVWILADFAHKLPSDSRENVMDKICDLLDRTYSVETQCWILHSIMKLSARHAVSHRVKEIIDTYKGAYSTQIEQICSEFEQMLQSNELERYAVTKDSRSVKVDPNFLSDFVKEALSTGAKAYIPESSRTLGSLLPEISEKKLRFTEYEAPALPPIRYELPREENQIPNIFISPEASQISLPPDPDKITFDSIMLNQIRSPAVWGPEGYQVLTSATPSQVLAKGNAIETKVERKTPERQEIKKPASQSQISTISPEKERTRAALFGGISVPSTAIEQSILIEAKNYNRSPSVPQNRLAPNLLDLSFDSSAPLPPEPLFTSLFSENTLKMSYLWNEIEGKPRSSDKSILMGTDNNLRISYFKVWDQDAATIALLLSNESNSPITKLVLVLDIPLQLLFSVQSENGSALKDTVTIDTLESFQNVCTDNLLNLTNSEQNLVLLKFSIQKLELNMPVKGRVSYHLNKQTEARQMALNFPVEVVDFIRPTSITESNFFSSWSTLPSEKLMNIENPHSKITSNFSESFQFIASKLNVQLVNVKVNEAIFSGRLIGSSNSSCLLHCKIDKDKLHVAVHSDNAVLAEGVAQYCSYHLRSQFAL